MVRITWELPSPDCTSNSTAAKAWDGLPHQLWQCAGGCILEKAEFGVREIMSKDLVTRVSPL